MRLGVVVSAIGHVGAVLMTLIAWPQGPPPARDEGSIVPVEIVTISDLTDVRALVRDAPDAASQEETPPAEQEAAPPPAPAPPQQRPQPRQSNELDLAELNDLLLDKQRPQGRRNQPDPNAQRADRSRRGAGLGAAETARLQDYIRSRGDAHIGRCWRVPLDSANPERLRVVIEFDLDRTAHIRGQPRLVYPNAIAPDRTLRAAIDNAMSAVRACDPYPFADDPLTSDHYELWRQITYNLDPSNFNGR